MHDFIDALQQKGKSNIIEVPFESFVFKPFEPIKEITACLGTSPYRTTNREMKKQMVPRRSLSDAPLNKYYKKSGWVKAKTQITVEQEFDISRKKIKEKASTEAMQVLDKLTDTYIRRYNIL